MSTMSHHLRRMKEYSLLRSSVNIRTPFSFPRHFIRALRFHSPQFLIGLAREMLHCSYSNEKSGVFLITLPRELLHRSYSNEDVAKSSALFQTLFFIQKEAIASYDFSSILQWSLVVFRKGVEGRRRCIKYIVGMETFLILYADERFEEREFYNCV